MAVAAPAALPAGNYLDLDSLLDDEERSLLRALSVFPAGLNLNGVERLAQHGGLHGDPAAVIARLVDASVAVTETTMRRNRFRLLETVRAFALEDAQARGERDELDRCLVGTVLDILTDLAAGLDRAARCAVRTPAVRAPSGSIHP